MRTLNTQLEHDSALLTANDIDSARRGIKTRRYKRRLDQISNGNYASQAPIPYIGQYPTTFDEN
jgi:hypothetical protein